MASISQQAICVADETTSSRALRLIASALLIIIALLECGVAALVVAGLRSFSHLIFLICTMALVAASAISLREHNGRVLLAVQSAAAAALLSLFWASGNQQHGGVSITIGHSTYELTLTLAGLLFIALLLARLLRRSPAEQACKCG